jgi:hypothetical protein
MILIIKSYFQAKGLKFSVRDQIVPRMKELVKITIFSALEKLQ